MEELIVPPRTLDVQQFAKARATELLSLHSVLKTNKRKAPRQRDKSSLDELQGTHDRSDWDGGDGDGGGDDNVDNVVYSGTSTSTSLPRHLRRRTSSYTHRRRPLPWLYKRKRDSTILPSSLLSCPKKRRKRQSKRQKQPQLPQQNMSSDVVLLPRGEFGDSLNAHQVSAVANGTVFGSVSNHVCHGVQLELTTLTPQTTPNPLTAETPLQKEEQETLHVQQQEPMELDVISSFQASGAGGTTSMNIHDTNASVKLDTSGDAALNNACESVHVGCIVLEENSTAFRLHGEARETSSEDPNRVHATMEVSSYGVNEDGCVNSSQGNNKDASPVLSQIASQAVQEERVQSVGDYLGARSVDNVAPSVKAESHEVRQEVAILSGQLCRESSTSLRLHDSADPARQQDSIDLSSPVAAPMCMKTLASDLQTSTFEAQDIRKAKKNKKISRALRRLLEFKSDGSLTSSDGTRRLATHVWHAKRFTIEKMWGYRIPLGRQGRGHGSRSVLRWSNSSALLHDCSFINAIQLQGAEEKIMQVLRPVLELPHGFDTSFEAEGRELPQSHFIKAILHRAGQDFHHVISPVTLMWKPLIPNGSTSSCTDKKEDELKEQNLWLWVHAAAFEEAFQLLKDICFQVNVQTKEDRVLCFSREGELGQLDLIGEESFSVLQKVVFPVYRDHQGKSIKLKQLAEVLDPKQLKERAVVYLEVADPRLKENERCLALDPICISPVAVFDDRGSKSKQLLGKDPEKVAEVEAEQEQETYNMIHEEEAHSNNKSVNSLWACEENSSQQNNRQPVREKYLSRMRHTDKLDGFGLTQAANSNRMLERRKNMSGRFICPLIILKHDHKKASGRGWSLILPLSWISAFWVPLVFAGGHVIGIRERHWLSTDAGTPSFPDDYPDCKAYVDTKTDKSLRDEFFWKGFTTRGLLRSEEISETVDKVVLPGPLVQSPSMIHAVGEGKGGNPEYSCFVARTSRQLVSYLHMVRQTGLLLFPAQKQILTKFRGLGSRLREGTVVWRSKPQGAQVPRVTHYVQSVCFLRVSLRPFCKGVAKVGAIVYAPTLEDYSAWSCKETESGTYTLEKHNSARALGFVTSMAPRGSKDSAAIAFCDAVALGLARQQQWLETSWQKKSEVFLMFCNEGSTTFRPAFVSIGIEAGPDI